MTSCEGRIDDLGARSCNYCSQHRMLSKDREQASHTGNNHLVEIFGTESSILIDVGEVNSEDILGSSALVTHLAISGGVLWLEEMLYSYQTR